MATALLLAGVASGLYPDGWWGGLTGALLGSGLAVLGLAELRCGGDRPVGLALLAAGLLAVTGHLLLMLLA
ncbi:hypothetical protein Rxycam_01010 [Rubrobacter xylanophilus DSM 9941]|uniref:hypothetical protein n=1 Tax=Rubrobacter xylanophilus TaxID=49319 RepID=UPI001C642457|nr:hypothetical protein [Rubrobacter xylanophilus]QYJ15195.1 hypothetical protein Rxycam_01010 [Rubrobacter xylanophilus DSM 9941]